MPSQRLAVEEPTQVPSHELVLRHAILRVRGEPQLRTHLLLRIGDGEQRQHLGDLVDTQDLSAPKREARQPDGDERGRRRVGGGALGTLAVGDSHRSGHLSNRPPSWISDNVAWARDRGGGVKSVLYVSKAHKLLGP